MLELRVPKVPDDRSQVGPGLERETVLPGPAEYDPPGLEVTKSEPAEIGRISGKVLSSPGVSRMTERADVVVLGGGIVGSAISYHLARCRCGPVVTIDLAPSGPRDGATSASAGILSYPGWDAWDLAIVQETYAEYRTLSEMLGLGGFRTNGGVRVTACEEGVRWFELISQVLGHHGIESEGVGPDRLGELLPGGVPEGARAGLYTPGDATVSAPELASAYLRLARGSGGDFVQTPIPPRIDSSEGRWRVELADRVVETRSLALATGAWTKRLLEGLGHPLPLAPFRTQACRLRPRPLAREFPTLHDIDQNHYVAPTDQGRLVAGDGTERIETGPDRADRAADSAFLERMSECVRAGFPEFESVQVEMGWAGVCVASPDRYPLVGRVPGTSGLFVATGFNGFGVMRAAGLARRLVVGILEDRWEGLGPADPGRFPTPDSPFDPRPAFPLDTTADAEGAARRLEYRVPAPQEIPALSEEVLYGSVGSAVEVDRLRLPEISEWFGPFLPLFMKEALRTHGRVVYAEINGEVRGIQLQGSVESVGSFFTRTRPIAEHFLSQMGPHGAYSERSWLPGGTPIDVLAADLRDWPGAGTIRNVVRIAQLEDLPALRTLVREVSGPGEDSWFDTLPRPEETVFLCEIDHRVVGMSGLTRVGPYARGHSFLVHPRYRGLGIGTDLLLSRMMWLARTGGRFVVSEIYDGNTASHLAASKAGMAVVGRMYQYRPNQPR